MTTLPPSDVRASSENYVLPEELPPPERHARRPWAIAGLVGLLAALFAGFCLFATGRVVYLYLLFGGMAGAMVGWPFAWGLKHVHSVNRWGAALAVTCFLALAYFSYSVGFYLWWTQENFGADPALSVDRYLAMLSIKANQFSLFGTKVGPAGAGVAWTIDYLVAWYVAWGAVDLVLMWETARLVPHATARMVFHLKREGYKDDQIRQRLAERGWSNPVDQTAAIRAAAAAERLHRMGVRIFTPASRSASA